MSRSVFRWFTMLAACTAGLALQAQMAVSLRVDGLPRRGVLETAGRTLTVEGAVTAPAGLARLFATDPAGTRRDVAFEPAASGPPDYRFSLDLAGLRPGLNNIQLEAVDPDGAAASITIPVVSGAGAEAPPERRTGHWRGRPVTYQVREGQAVVEGDILLGPAETLERDETPAGKPAEIRREGLTALNSSSLWPVDAVTHVAQVPYTIVHGSASMTTAIGQFNTIFSGLIQFVPRTAEADYVAVDLSSGDHSGSCFATLGHAGGKQDLQGSIDCGVSTLLHEMGHAIGLYHEHQRPDYPTFLTFNGANLDLPLQDGNFGFVSSNARTVGLYDYASIMHYSARGFSKNDQVVLETIPAGIPIGESSTYSPGDIDAVQRLYGTAPSAVTVTTNPPGLPIVVDNVTLTAPQTFAWALGSNHTIGAPSGYQQPSPADGARYAFGNWNDGGAQSHQITITAGDGGPATPTTSPAVTVYQAAYQRYAQFNPGINGTTGGGSGSLSLNPLPTTISGASYYRLRTAVTGQAVPSGGSVFTAWYGNDYLPTGQNPRTWIVSSSPWYIQADLETARTLYTVSSTFTNPAPPTSPANPAVTALIDGATHVIPEIFTSTQGWTTGTNHTLNVSSTQYPVTTNVGYQFNNWTLGAVNSANAAQNLVLPASSTTYTASFTPSYRGYSLVNPYCAAATPVADNHYLDGALVNFHVTPISQWTFAGFSGSLTGVTNPQSLTVHDEFAVTANLNTNAAPLTVTGFSPSSLNQGGAGTLVTITGTGFSASTKVFVDGYYSSQRTVQYVDAQHLKVQINTSDLTTAGGFPIGVQNAANGCSVFAEGSFTVNPTVAHWQITKSHAGNFTQGATGQYSIVVTNNGGAASSGLVTVTDTPPAGMTVTSMSGSGWTCNGSSCTTSAALAAGASYPTLTANVSISASAATSLTNQVSVSGGGAGSAAASDATTILQVPAAISAIGGSGQSTPVSTAFAQPLQAKVTDAGGAGIAGKSVTFAGPASGAGVAFTSANPAVTNGSGIASVTVTANGTAGGPYQVNASVSGVGTAAHFSLTNTSGSNIITFGTIPSKALGSAPFALTATASSGLAVTYTSNSTSICTVSGSTVTLLAAGTCSITAHQGGNASYPAASPVTRTFAVTEPSTISVTPASGTGSVQSFAAAYMANKGYTDLQWVQLLFATAPDGGGQSFCYIHYDVQGNAFWLYGDVGFFVGPIAPGAASNTLQNTLCAVNTSASSASGSGTTLTVNANVVFKSTTARKVYLRAMNKAGSDTGWVQRGSWNATAAALGTMTVAPGSGSGSTQTFTLTYPDPSGFAGAAFGWKQFLVAAASDGGGQPFCYIHYDRGGNAFWMYSGDVGFFVGPVPPGTASNALSSSACSMNTAASAAANQSGSLVLTVPLTLKAPMSGAKKLFERTLDVLSRDTGWQQTGTWTVP